MPDSLAVVFSRAANWVKALAHGSLGSGVMSGLPRWSRTNRSSGVWRAAVTAAGRWRGSPTTSKARPASATAARPRSTSGRASQSGSGSISTGCLMPARCSPPGSSRSSASASAMPGAVRSAQPTTPATSPGPEASASSSGVSQDSVTVCTTTLAVTPAAAASGARSARAKLRSSGASTGSLTSHGWWCADRSQKCWWESMTGAPAAGGSGGGAPAAVTGSLHLVEPARGDVEDKPTDGIRVRHERARLDPGDRLAHVLVQVAEGLCGPRRLDPGLVLYRLLESVIGEREHAAVGVVDQDDLRGAEQPLADRQRPDLVVGDDPAGVPDDVGLTVAQAEDGVDVEPGVHAGDDGDVRGRRHRQRAAEALRVACVVGQVLVGGGHGTPARRWDRCSLGGGPEISILTRFVPYYLFSLLVY